MNEWHTKRKKSISIGTNFCCVSASCASWASGKCLNNVQGSSSSRSNSEIRIGFGMAEVCENWNSRLRIDSNHFGLATHKISFWLYFYWIKTIISFRLIILDTSRTFCLPIQLSRLEIYYREYRCYIRTILLFILDCSPSICYDIHFICHSIPTNHMTSIHGA